MRATGAFTIAGVTSALGLVWKGPVARVVRQLVSEGLVIDRGLRGGFYVVGALPGRVTLAEVRQCVDQHGSTRQDDDTPEAGPGRKGAGRKRRFEKVTPALQKKTRRALAYAAKKLADGDLAGVANEQLGWDEAHGNWTLVAVVRRLTEADSDLSAHDRASYPRGIEVALDLGASHGILTRQPCHAVAGWETHAGEWEAPIATWLDEIVLRNPSANRVTVLKGLRAVARHATRQHSTRVETTDWPAVQGAVEAEHQQWIAQKRAGGSDPVVARLPDPTYSAVRYVWRRLALLQRAAPWRHAPRRRLGLVPNTAITLLVRSAAKSAALPSTADEPDPACALDFSGWVDHEGHYLQALVEGKYGLRRWVRWATAPASVLSLEGLPERAWPAPTAEQEFMMAQAARKGTDLFHLAEATLTMRLEHLNRLAGFAARFAGFDGRVHDLTALARADLVKRYDAWREHNPPADYDPEREALRKRKGIDGLADTVAKLASPYMQAVALAAGDAATAERALDCSKEAKKVAYRRKPITNECKIISAISTAWTVDGRSGFLLLEDLVELLLREAELEAGMPLDAMIASIERGQRPSHAWALLIRSATMLNLLRIVPLRARTLSLLKRRHWKNTAVSAEELAAAAAAALREWEGEINLDIPGTAMKQKRPFSPALIHRALVGDEEAEASVRRPLLKAWFMSGGARDIVLTPPGGSAPLPSEYVFPRTPRRSPNIRRGGRLLPRSLSAWFRRTVVRHATALRLDIRRLAELHGALGVHVVRLLYGTYWVGEGMTEQASLMLSHGDVGFTVRLYSGRTERDASLHVGRRARAGSAAGTEATRELQALLDATARQARAAEERVAALEQQLQAVIRQNGELMKVLTARIEKGALT